MSSNHFANFKEAVRHGIDGSCHYNCQRYPESYRFPGVSELEDGNEDETIKLYAAIAALQPIQQNFKKTGVYSNTDF